MFNFKTLPELIFTHPGGEESRHPLRPEPAASPVLDLSGLSRLETFKRIAANLHNDACLLLYDAGVTSIKARIAHGLPILKRSMENKALFFTSGTTGTPTGAFKTRQNLMDEIRIQAKIFKTFEPESFISTVPQIHVYGFLGGLLLPLYMGVNAVIKEEFLPHELIETLKKRPRSAVVTSPVFIRALLRIKTDATFKEAVFVSSTGLLSDDEALAFETRYQTRVIQIYGSTETGGVANRLTDKTGWAPLAGVHLELDAQERLVVRSPFVSRYLLGENIHDNHGAHNMADLADLSALDATGRFELVGRSSDIVKIGGKRVSTQEIENHLEQQEALGEVLVLPVVRPGALKDESLAIYICSQTRPDHARIKELLKACYPALHLPFELFCALSIPKNATGKKIRKPLQPHHLKPHKESE